MVNGTPDSAASLPGILDVLIVGGGPAGTAAAFRAVELGLSVLVIDRDEILSILCEWISPDGDANKDKRVDSSYGPGGKRIPFPAGGELVSELVFGDRVPASQLYDRWIDIYNRNEIPHRSGLELVGMEHGDDGLIRAQCTNQATREEPTFSVRSVVLAMGRGVPHKIQVPGDPTGINYKLKDPQGYTGHPACVIGGGTSAAEAVIAISNAKAAAGDQSDVFWSYRRRSLPKVNSTLAGDFFAAFSGNGNIRYLPYSEPIAVLKGPAAEFVALRSERRDLTGRPPEGTYLEFPKERVLACIGADLPVKLLDSVGIQMLRAADEDEDYMAVTPLLETVLSNVFLIGDLLSPAHIQTTDFGPEAEQSTVIDHLGNFKQSTIDGVLTIEAIAQRRDGKSDEEIGRFLDQKVAEYKELHLARLAQQKEEAPEPLPEPDRAQPAQIGAKIVHLVGLDKREAREYFFAPGTAVIGRTAGDIFFADDEALVDDHARILVEPDASYVSTEGTAGDCLVGVAAERTIRVGDMIFAGHQTMRVESSNGELSLAVLDQDGKSTTTLPITAEGKSYGRQNSARGLAIDLEDLALSRRHFYLQAAGNVISLRDYGSTNGTYLKVSGALRLNEGDEILAGSQRLLFKGMQTGVVEAAPRPRKERAAPAAPSAVPPAAAPTGGGPGVTVMPMGESLAMTADQTILDKLIQENIATQKPAEIGDRRQMLYECKKGTCGKCVVAVLGGEESLSKLTGKEKRTLKLIVPELVDQGMDLDVAKCHLACRATVTGPVQVQLLGDTETAD